MKTSLEKKKRDKLIPILQEVQEKEGFLSRESILKISKELDLPTSKIYGVASFYNQFRFQPRGQYQIQLCRGTACHVLGSAKILEILEGELGIKHGETTRDGKFSLEIVACIGACGLAPVISINGEFFAKLNPEKLRTIINEFRQKDQNNVK
ncbi:MAG: NADH dehydrogenase [Candidatus Melainabacteria bacterium GWF2_37_15]|nr:MAG: NADH dehydrogenase [Candidatus Melainabacteria bacterium GWF2_37_15]